MKMFPNTVRKGEQSLRAQNWNLQWTPVKAICCMEFKSWEVRCPEFLPTALSTLQSLHYSELL